MLVDLKTPLLKGATVPLVLTFKEAGEVTVQLKIEPQDNSASTTH
jgi:copper(I)-binding protein